MAVGAVENRPRFSKDRWARSLRPRVRQRPRPLALCTPRASFAQTIDADPSRGGRAHSVGRVVTQVDPQVT